MIRALLLLFVVSWLPNTELDLCFRDPVTRDPILCYVTELAERHVVAWHECPLTGGGSYLCPEYNAFVWWSMGSTGTQVEIACAPDLHQVCFYKLPRAFDRAGNISPDGWIGEDFFRE